MRKFVYQIGLFGVILFILNLLLFNLGNDLYYKKYDKYSLEFNNYLFSDSHGEPLGKHTENFNVYNFSTGSDSYIDIKRKINFLLEKTTLDTIYLSADEHMFSPYREKLNNSDKSSFYTTINDFSTAAKYYKSEVSQNIIYFQPKMGTILRKYFVSNIESLFISEKVQEINTYPNWNERSEETKQERINKRIETQYNYQESSKILKETLLEIINICETNNIVIVGVKFPLTKEYYSIIKDKVFGVDSIFKDKKLKVLDFQATYLDKDYLFYNEDHLTTEGGKIFADVLFKESQVFIND